MAQSVTTTSCRIFCHLTLLSHYWTKVKRRTLSSSWTEQSEKEIEWKHWILEPVALTLKLLSRFHCQIYSSNRIECINHTHKGIRKKGIKEWCLKWIKNLICDHSKFGQDLYKKTAACFDLRNITSAQNNIAGDMVWIPRTHQKPFSLSFVLFFLSRQTFSIQFFILQIVLLPPCEPGRCILHVKPANQ